MARALESIGDDQSDGLAVIGNFRTGKRQHHFARRGARRPQNVARQFGINRFIEMRNHGDSAHNRARSSHVERANRAQANGRGDQNRVRHMGQGELGGVFGFAGDFEARVLARCALADNGLHNS